MFSQLGLKRKTLLHMLICCDLFKIHGWAISQRHQFPANSAISARQQTSYRSCHTPLFSQYLSVLLKVVLLVSIWKSINWIFLLQGWGKKSINHIHVDLTELKESLEVKQRGFLLGMNNWFTNASLYAWRIIFLERKPAKPYIEIRYIHFSMQGQHLFLKNVLTKPTRPKIINCYWKK